MPISNETIGGSSLNLRNMEDFFLLHSNLQLNRHWFPRIETHLEKNSIQERLDCCFANLNWLQSFPSSSTHHLNYFKFDHRLVMVTLQDYHNYSQKKVKPPFSFLVAWLMNEYFGKFVKDIWQKQNSWLLAVANFMKNVGNWNNNVFGNIFKEKKKIIRRL